jgi:hypothetical protein
VLVSPVYDFDLPWFWPYELMFSTQRYQEVYSAASGLMWLLGLPFILLAIYQKQTRLLSLCALASIALLFSSMHYLRYVMPGLMLLSLLICAALSQLGVRSRLRKMGAVFLIFVVLIQLGLQQNSSWIIYDTPLAFSFWQDRHRATQKFFAARASTLAPIVALAKSTEPTQPMLIEGAALFAGQAINLSWHSSTLFSRWLEVTGAKPDQQQAKMEALLDTYQPSHFFYAQDLPEPIQAALDSRGTSLLGDGVKPYWVMRWPQIEPVMHDHKRGVLNLSRRNSPITRVDLTAVCDVGAHGANLILQYQQDDIVVSTDAKWSPCLSVDGSADPAKTRVAHFQWSTRARAVADHIAFEIQGDITHVREQKWEILNSDFAAGNYRRKAFAWRKTQ